MITLLKKDLNMLKVFILFCLSAMVFAGYNKERTVHEAHFLDQGIYPHFLKSYPDLSIGQSDYDFMGATYKSHYVSGGKKITPIIQKASRAKMINVSIPANQIEKEIAWRQSVYFIKNQSRGYSFGTGFMIAPGVLMTNAHVYKDDSENAKRFDKYEKLNRNDKMFFIGSNKKGVRSQHTKLFCSNLDYCLIYIDAFKDRPYLNFSQHEQLGEDKVVTLLGYPGFIMSKFWYDEIQRKPDERYNSKKSIFKGADAVMASTGRGLLDFSKFHASRSGELQESTANYFKKWRKSTILKGVDYIDMTAMYFMSSSPGTSGGPVVDNDGQVLAVNFFGSNISTEKEKSYQGFTLGLKAKYILKDIKIKCLIQKKYKEGEHYYQRGKWTTHGTEKEKFFKGKEFCEFMKNKYSI